jgi:hypothetical protein
LKLAGFVYLLLVIPAFAQSAQFGTRIGQVQTAYLADIPSPVGTIAVTGAARFGDLPARPTDANQAPVYPKADFETWVEQKSRDYAESVVTGFVGIEREAGKAAIHRYVRDNFRQTYLTYTMTLESVPGTKTFRVAFSDSAIPVPVPQILRDGETLALTLAADARTGRRMVEYIRVGTGIMPLRQAVARDVYAEDAELTITQAHLRINGVEQAAGKPPAMLSAPVVEADIPGHGRYLLSFKPRADQGFERAGEVAEGALVFSLGGNIFRIDSADRIATGSGTYNIYARKDTALPDDPASFALSGRR